MEKSKITIKPILSERIKEQRKLKRITQAELGEFIGVQDQTIRKYESGRHTIPKTSVTSIAKVFGCCEEYLYGETNCFTREEYEDEQKNIDRLINHAVEYQNYVTKKWQLLCEFAPLFLNCTIKDTVMAKKENGVLESITPVIDITLSDDKRYLFYSKRDAEEFFTSFFEDCEKLFRYHLLDYIDSRKTYTKPTRIKRDKPKQRTEK